MYKQSLFKQKVLVHTLSFVVVLSFTIITGTNPLQQAYSINPINLLTIQLKDLYPVLLMNQTQQLNGLQLVSIKWKMSKHLQHLIPLSI